MAGNIPIHDTPLHHCIHISSHLGSTSRSSTLAPSLVHAPGRRTAPFCNMKINMALKTRRKLKRNVSRETIPVEVRSIKCVRGGMRKLWYVLETQSYLGRECIGIKRTAKWLHCLLNGQVHKSKFHNAISNLVSDCFEALHQQTDGPSASSQDSLSASLEDQPADASASSQAAGRAAIFGNRTPDSDDDEPKAIAKKARRASTTRSGSKGWATISVRNMSITCYCGKGRQLLVPLDTGDMNRIIEHLLPRVGEAKQASRAVDFGTMMLEESDRKLICWRRFPAGRNGYGCWVVNYKDKDGNTAHFQTGLVVPRRNLAGDVMMPQEQKEAASMVLLKAKRAWNDLDQSDHARFQDEVE